MKSTKPKAIGIKLQTGGFGLLALTAYRLLLTAIP